MSDAVTAKWVRNKSDELAVAAGCVFDEERGQYVVDWIQNNLNLYEGSTGPMILGDWQHEATMRMFGWVKWSERLQRWIRRFTRASIWIAKKNGKSPTAAAWALYLMAGDGEQGQHVYIAAADGSQARIVANHAMEMMKASPALSSECDPNLSLMKITHLPTRSDVRPISSGDTRAAKAKQGANGSVVVDEVHVISREFISQSSIDQAGVSRDEPFFIEVSTAGKDPDGYGKSQYDYGKKVESGEINDDRLFFLSYEAPQQLSDAELDADPVKWGKMANPTWGRIVQEDEFLAAYKTKKQSIADLSDFKTFRLNIWQNASSPWLRVQDWKECRRDFTELDLEGRTCAAALDLSLTRDMTAFSLCFPPREDLGEDLYWLLTYFFLPEEGFRRIAEKVPRIHEWRRAGFVTVTPGSDLAYSIVEEKVGILSELFSIEMLVYDPHYANHLTQRIEEEYGIERLKFAQQAGMYAEPTAMFEKLVLSRKIAHNGNEVMDWQIGHCNVKTDANGYKRPVKPEHNDVKKIDGCVSGIMSVAGALRSNEAYQPGSLRD